jgi:thiamine pyrophosphokinase
VSKYSLDILPDHYDALLVANGTPPSRVLFNQLRKRAARLIALDGGLETCFRYRVAPHDVIGDFDSISSECIQWARNHGAKIHPRPSASEPDFAKGLTFCKRHGLRHVLAAGCVGDRADHIFSACHFVFQIRGVDAHLITDSVAIFPIRGKRTLALSVPDQHLISWFGMPAADHCSLSGVKWPFRNRALSLEGFHSLSNRPIGEEVRASQQSGHSMLIVSICQQTAK